MKWMDKETRKDRKPLDKAFKNKKVREFLKQENLGFDDLKEAYRRIQILGIRNSAKKKALRDIEVLKRLFSKLGPERSLDLDDFLMWSNFVINKPGL